MKKINLLITLVFSYLTVGCSSYVILFKPPAQMDPVPKKESEVARSAESGEEEKVSWSMEAIGMDKAYFTKQAGNSGNKNVKVAILSTGIDYNHEDLAGQVLVNRNEITEGVDINPSVNYQDDDGNGKVDDIVGLDVVDGDGIAFDRHGAGTAVAGIIAAKGNGYGVKGMVDNVSLYPVRYINENGQSDVPKLAAALEEALKVKSDVVYVQSLDLPFGGGQMQNPEALKLESGMLKQVLDKYSDTEIPIVVGAGESLQEFKETPLGEVFLGSANVIVVTSTDKSGNLGLLANRGNRSVELAAPGEKILTTAPNNKYQEVRGTAYAAAHVAGAIALAKSLHGENLKLKDHIVPVLSSARANTPSSGVEWVTLSGAILNVPKVLAAIEEKMN